MPTIETQIASCNRLISDAQSNRTEYFEALPRRAVTQERLGELREKLVMIEYMARDGQRD